MSKRKMVRVLSLVLIGVFTMAILLTGCGSQSAGNTATSATSAAATTTAAVETTAKALDPVELTWYMPGTTANTADMPGVMEKVNTILKDKINAKLNFNQIEYADYDTKIQVIIAASEAYDLCYTASWLNLYGPNVAKGAFLAIDDLLNKYGTSMLSTIPAKYWDAAKVNGKIYAMLNYQFFATKSALWVKKDLADKYQFDYKNATKLQDFEPFLANVMKGEKGINPILINAGSIGYNDPSNGALYYQALPDNFIFYVNGSDTSLKVVNLFDTQAFKDKYSIVRDWYLKGYLPKDVAIKEQNASLDEKAGKYAVWCGGNAKPGADVDMTTAFGYNVACIPMNKTYVDASGILATMTAVSKNSKNPDRAVMFYDMLYSDKELYNTLVFGLEDKNYKKLSEDTIDLIPNSGYTNSGWGWAMGNQFNAYYLKGQQPGLWEETKKMNEDAEPSPLMGFSYNSDAMKTELTAITAVYNEYKPRIMYGTEDMDKLLTEFNKKLESAGMSKVMADIQAQLDQWKTANGK